MLRKVKYRKNSEFYARAFASMDPSSDSFEERIKEREGFFHMWIGEHNVNGLIEDAETGEVQKIEMTNITFLERPFKQDIDNKKDVSAIN